MTTKTLKNRSETKTANPAQKHIYVEKNTTILPILLLRKSARKVREYNNRSNRTTNLYELKNSTNT